MRELLLSGGAFHRTIAWALAAVAVALAGANGGPRDADRVMASMLEPNALIARIPKV
jgi:hypothetical protein